MITINDKNFIPYISYKQIQERIVSLSKEIARDYKNEEVHFICVLNGSLFFTADLLKNYPYNCVLHTVKCKSYEGTESSGKIEMQLEFNEGIIGNHVIILEDIIDTGFTLNFLLNRIKKFNIKSIKIASLLVKPDALKYPVTIDYTGFVIPNKFVLGYGLDYDGYGRNLKDIYQLSI